MKIILTLFASCLLLHFSYSQNILLDIPINKTDSLQDLSDIKNEVSYQYFDILFTTDESGNDSSAISLGARKSIEISPEKLLNASLSNLTFSLKVLQTPEDAGNESYINSYALLFGQLEGIGLEYNYPDSTLRDTEGLLSYKLEDQASSWNLVKLEYGLDSTVTLSVNNNVVVSAKRSTNQLLNNNTMGVGLVPHYLYAKIDSIRITTTPEQVTNTFSGHHLSEMVTVIPNPVVDYVHLDNIPETTSSLYIITLRGSLVKTVLTGFDSIDMSDLPSGCYFMVLETNQGTIRKSFIKQ